MDTRDKLSEIDEEIICADGFDDCIIGVAEGASIQMLAVYDTDQVIEKLAKSMSEQEAREYFNFNIIAAYVGERTPIFVTRLFDDEQSEEVPDSPEGKS